MFDDISSFLFSLSAAHAIMGRGEVSDYGQSLEVCEMSRVPSGDGIFMAKFDRTLSPAGDALNVSEILS